MKRIRPERVAAAIEHLQEWRDTVRTQTTAHLMPLLALLWRHGGVEPSIHFEEKDDFDFWDRYLRIDDGNSAKPYFNPMTRRRAEANFPHSNAATARKGTFDKSWAAGKLEVQSDESWWSLSPAYADIVADKVMTKGGQLTRAPAIDVAVILMRDQEWPDEATCVHVVQRFRTTFPQQDGDFDKLFVVMPEDDEHLFTMEPVDVPGSYDSAIKQQLLDDAAAAPPPQYLQQLNEEPDDDPVYQQVLEVLKLSTHGIIFRGPPGTGKTWHAKRIARRLVADPENDVFAVQFHPSYGYEDFVEGFRPDDSAVSGFRVVPKHFLKACERAKVAEKWVVVIVDEINRGDPARVFGELLTYLEYRGTEFSLPFSGDEAVIPKNLLLIGTMNPYDRSIARIDAAFTRRFDHIEIDPSSEALRDIVGGIGTSFSTAEVDNIVSWFELAQTQLPIGLGHALFREASDTNKLRLVWRRRVLPTVESIIAFDPVRRQEFVDGFSALLAKLEGTTGGGN